MAARSARSEPSTCASDLARFSILSLAGTLPVQVDGEYLGEVDEAVFVHEPDVLRLVMPGV